MKNPIRSFIGSFMILTISFCSCKSDSNLIQPVGITAKAADTDGLITYLARSLSVSKNDIFFDYSARLFVIKGSLKITEKDAVSMYSVANEYKKKYSIID